MEKSLKLARKPNIIIVVKAFGIRATVQLMDLHIFTVPQVILKPFVHALVRF
jgi:hypothetical protein